MWDWAISCRSSAAEHGLHKNITNLRFFLFEAFWIVWKQFCKLCYIIFPQLLNFNFADITLSVTEYVLVLIIHHITWHELVTEHLLFYYVYHKNLITSSKLSGTFLQRVQDSLKSIYVKTIESSKKILNKNWNIANEINCCCGKFTLSPLINDILLTYNFFKMFLSKLLKLNWGML